MNRRVAVYGPAYLDRVIRVDRPLVAPGSQPLDQSVDGELKGGAGPGFILRDPSGFRIDVECPNDWPGPTGLIELNRILIAGTRDRRRVLGVAWLDDLGGMGAGFAAALQGVLISALGAESDSTSMVIESLLSKARISHRPIRVAAHPADWTLLLTSGGHGDKLPIGFRGCHAALTADQFDSTLDDPAEVLVVAALPNCLGGPLLSRSGARLRFFAPAMRNMLDEAHPISRFSGSIDLLCCNRHEWEALKDSQETAWRVSILAITDGPQGVMVRFTHPTGDPGRIVVPAFPRRRPPVDTNRAGEAFASTLLSTLIEQGWEPESGVIEEAMIRFATLRGSAAAGLVLDRAEFGFASAEEIDAAIRLGRID